MLTSVSTKEDLIQRLRAAHVKLHALGVTTLGVFGSFAAGSPTADSDVDVLVEFAPGKHTFDNFMDVVFLLEELLGRHVEVVTREALSPHIGPHILREVEYVTLAA